MNIDEIKKALLLIIKKEFNVSIRCSESDDIDLRQYVKKGEKFLLLTIKIEDVFKVDFDPYLEYESISSVNSLVRTIYNLKNDSVV